MKETPYWWEEAPLAALPATDLPQQTDVAIIGCGYTGLSAALTLLEKGRSVVLLEEQRAGEGASSRNGGMCGDILKPTFSQLSERCGRRTAVALYSETRDALTFLKHFVSTHAIACDLAQVGRLTGVLSERQVRSIEDESALLKKEVGIDYHMVSKRDLRDEIGSDLYVGARIHPHHAGLHPAKYVAGLIRIVRERGANIHDRTRLLSYVSVGRDFELVTSRGKLRTRDLIIATNGYTGAATSWLRRRIVPVTSYMIATEVIPPATMRELFPKGRLVIDTNRLLVYYRPSPDGTRILFGGRPAYTKVSLETSARRLMDYLRQIFPALRTISVAHSWFGYIGYTFDHLPHVGTQDGVHYAAGYCGSGVVLATWLGRKAAHRLLGDSEGKSAFANLPHPTHPLYRGRPWFLPLVQAWYQLQDASVRR
jgi:glycine/D-amino acid oxidase-like deaminating enzyme